MGLTKRLDKRIKQANRWIRWAQNNDVFGTGYFGSTWPVQIAYTHDVKVSPGGNIVTVRYTDGGKPTTEKFDLRTADGAEDLRYEISTYIVQAIKNGAKDDGLRIPSIK